jgi:hypothetical protein
MDLVSLKEQMIADQEESVELSKIKEKSQEEVEAIILPKKKSKKIKRTISFPIDYNDADKDKTLNEMLKSKVMDSKSRLQYDKILMSLAGGYQFENYPQLQKTRFQCIARIICQLVEPAEWVLEKAGEDLDFCYALASNLVEHENRYFRYDNPEDSSKEGQSRFSIDFPKFEDE